MAVTQVDAFPPKPLPLVGHFPAYGRDPLGFVTRAAKVGGVLPIRMGPFPAVVVTDHAAIEEVLITRARDFQKSMATRRIGVVTGDGILITDGETWRQHRRAVQPAFHSDRIRAWAQVMTDEASATVSGWPDREVRDVHREMTELTLRIVVRTLMGSDIEPREIDTVGDAIAQLTDYFDSRFNGMAFFIPDFIPTPGNLRMRAAVRRLDRIIYRLISERLSGDGDDVISMLREQRTETGQRLTDREIRDEVMTLFLAGHETTALALTWSLWLLGRHPAAQQILHAELADVLGDRRPELGDISRLRYTEAVVNEALRLYPPAYAVSRETVRPTEVAGHRLGKGTITFVSVYAAHRNAELFAEPTAFRPERWLDGLARRLPKGAYVPFAEGPRKCIGASFAMQEAVLALATIAGRVRLSPAAPGEIEARPAVTLRPAGPVEMVISTAVAP